MKKIPTTKSEFMTLAWVLRKIDFFVSLSPNQVEELFPDIVLNEYQPNEIICKQGNPGDALYILKSGRLAVESKKGWFRSSVRVGTVSPGEFFGELALLSSQPRAATVRATELSQAYVLLRIDFWRALDRSPALAQEVRKVADRHKLAMKR